ARARPPPLGPSAHGGHRDRPGAGQDRGRNLRLLREVRPAHPEGQAQGAAGRAVVRRVPERGVVAPLMTAAGRGRRMAFLAAVAAVVVVIDQITKTWAENR